MKKFICIVLSAMLTMSLCSCGPNLEEIPFEECAGYATGTWVDPLGHTEDIVINEDKTANFMGENLTWEVTRSVEESPDLETDHSWFIVDFLDGDTLKYDVTFTYVDDPGLWISTSANCYDEAGEHHDLDDGAGWYYRVNPETAEIVKITLDNWDTYFSAMQFFEWEDTADIYDWTLDEYIVINPEIADRVLETNYKHGAIFEFFMQPYDYELDPDTPDVILGDAYSEGEIDSIFEEVYFTVNKADYMYKQDYLTTARIRVDKNFATPDHIYIADYFTIHDLMGTLILKK